VTKATVPASRPGAASADVSVVRHDHYAHALGRSTTLILT
jgi:hypothetical protein